MAMHSSALRRLTDHRSMTCPCSTVQDLFPKCLPCLSQGQTLTKKRLESLTSVIYITQKVCIYGPRFMGLFFLFL
ncbi:hypothetical protein C0J52_02125 [Blattella germanica]|nr:hypothetical protein C0J52_02125 [Blattella germanica]